MSDHTFPDWLPESIRLQLIRFWTCFGGTIDNWVQYVETTVPGGFGAVGAKRTIAPLCRDGLVTGRFVPMWNNIAQVVLDDGTTVAGSFEQASGCRTVEHAAWLARGEQLFGSNRNEWRFVCPACHNVQSIESVARDNPRFNRDDIGSWIHYNCQGRYTRVGCDWTLGGLFRGHGSEVVMDDGSVMPVFEFDDAKVDRAEDAPG